MNHSPREGRGAEAAGRGHQNCLGQVTELIPAQLPTENICVQ